MAAKWIFMVVAVFLTCLVKDVNSAKGDGKGRGKPSYIVLFKNKDQDHKSDQSNTETETMAMMADVETALSADVENENMNITRTYTKLIQGFACNLTAEVRNKLEKRSDIKEIVENTKVSIASKGRKPGRRPRPRPRPPPPPPPPEEPIPNWGLHRIATREPNYPAPDSGAEPEYLGHDENGGNGNNVHIYIVDSGILATHDEFKDGDDDSDPQADRVEEGFTAIDQGDPNTDPNGHGTHVAGTAAGLTHGVATKATLHPVQVLDLTGSGFITDIIDGLVWIEAHSKDFPKDSANLKKAVASMSLGGGSNTALDQAVKSLTETGVTVVVAAGNENRDACRFSPARAPEAITVGATDSSDNLASFSNQGDCVDILAPGVNIESAGYQDDTGFRTISGTSMSCPHVSGAVAILLGIDGIPSDSTVADKLDELATVITDLDEDTPNKLLFIGVEESGGDDVNAVDQS